MARKGMVSSNLESSVVIAGSMMSSMAGLMEMWWGGERRIPVVAAHSILRTMMLTMRMSVGSEVEMCWLLSKGQKDVEMVTSCSVES